MEQRKSQQLKILALSNDPDSLERLINDYFYSNSYELILKKEEGINYFIENKKLSYEYMQELNKQFIVKYKKGKYYFYRNEKEK